ncbi:MAG TPA: ATP-binding protein [Dermatophilaceae bacterium]|jgi:hypothetical protein
MAQPSTTVPDLPTDVDHHVGGPAALKLPAQPAGRSAAHPPTWIRRRVMRHVLVLEVTGRLGDVVRDLDQEIELALAEGPRGVVCDLSAVLEGAEPGAVEALAAAGRHPRDWPGVPVAMVLPDPLAREDLSAHPLGGHLIVTASLFSAVSAVLDAPALTAEWLHLAPHPTAMRASRDFVTCTLLDWRLGRVIRFARLVASELVMSSTVNAGTDIDLSVAWNLGVLRLTVRDYSPLSPRQRDSALGLHGRGLAVVAGLSRAYGVLPTADGGTVVWAVLDAPRLSTSQPPRKPDTAIRESPGFTDALGLGGLPFCAETGLHRTGDRVLPPPGGAPAQPAQPAQ